MVSYVMDDGRRDGWGGGGYRHGRGENRQNERMRGIVMCEYKNQ
jgi:hypothetical protein